MGIPATLGGISFEVNSILVLRAVGTEGREKEECLPRPEALEQGRIYNFKKSGRRMFPQGNRGDGEVYEISLCERPESQSDITEQMIRDVQYREIAKIKILEVSHRTDRSGNVFTTGKYQITKLNKI